MSSNGSSSSASTVNTAERRQRSAVQASRALRLLKEALVSQFGFTLVPVDESVCSLLIDVQANHQPWFSLTLYDSDGKRDKNAERPVIRELVLEHARAQRDVLTDEVTALIHWVLLAPKPVSKKRCSSGPKPSPKRGPAAGAAVAGVPEVDPDPAADFEGGYSFPTIAFGDHSPYVKLVRRHAHMKLVVYAHMIQSFEQYTYC